MDNKIAIEDILGLHIENPIVTKILPIKEVISYINTLFMSNYSLSEKVAAKILNKYLQQYFIELKDELYVLVESPYVDKIYRDTYYHYYSSKLNPYYRDCIRLSFFCGEVTLDNFRPEREGDDGIKKALKIKNVLNDLYLGFLILRPTFPKIIGRNSISPKAKKVDNVSCCLAKMNSSVHSIKQKIYSFPHASQDTQTMTCAETTVWALLEYFGNKYPEYKPVLLTHITKIMHRFSYKRLLPSDGLTAEQITYAIREFGFGAMIHSRTQREKTDFNIGYIISTYTESGIPIVGVLKNTEIGHAINIVGRENFDAAEIVKKEHHKIFNNAPVIDYNRLPRKYVFIDDNYPPYQLTTLDKPCKTYYEDEKWHDCDLVNIIVPLHIKVYLDAAKAAKNFYNIIGHPKFGIQGDEKRVLKIFLASTRSYKQYIALNEELNPLIKDFILALQMPKFIWIAEISKEDSFLNGKCDDLYIQDATEPHSDSSTFGNISLLAGYTNGTFFVQNFGNFKGLVTFAQPFSSYKDNLI